MQASNSTNETTKRTMMSMSTEPRCRMMNPSCFASASAKKIVSLCRSFVWWNFFGQSSCIWKNCMRYYKFQFPRPTIKFLSWVLTLVCVCVDNDGESKVLKKRSRRRRRIIGFGSLRIFVSMCVTNQAQSTLKWATKRDRKKEYFFMGETHDNMKWGKHTRTYYLVVCCCCWAWASCFFSDFCSLTK